MALLLFPFSLFVGVKTPFLNYVDFVLTLHICVYQTRSDVEVDGVLSSVTAMAGMKEAGIVHDFSEHSLFALL